MKKYLLLSGLSLLLLASLVVVPSLAATVTCPSSCSCLLPAKATELGYKAFCNGRQAVCGYDAKNEKFCYEKPVTPAPVPVKCGEGCSCLDPAKATASGYQYCDTPHAVCGYDTGKNPLYCFNKPETVTVTPVKCADGCSCMVPEKARAAGYEYCGGKQTVCDRDSAGNLRYCFEPPVKAVEVESTAQITKVVPVSCAKGCSCMDASTVNKTGYRYCGETRIPCGGDAGNPRYCFEKLVTGAPTREPQKCSSGCSCLAPDKATAAGYGYCGGTQVLCGYDDAKNPLFCYQKTTTKTVGEVPTTPTTVVVKKAVETPTMQMAKKAEQGFFSGILDRILGRSCPVGETRCSGACYGCSGQCEDLQTSVNHCGACGVSCASDEACIRGECVRMACPGEGQIVCSRHCISPESDEDHCGACGRRCASDEACIQGVCEPLNCGWWEMACDHQCVSRYDVEHCGACGQECPEGYHCGSAYEVIGLDTGEPHCVDYHDCILGTTFCYWGHSAAGSCVDTLRDEENCGECGNTCRPGTLCEGGECVCPSWKTVCFNDPLRGSGLGAREVEEARTEAMDFICTNLLTDAENCGACGNACQGAEECRGGECVCPPNMTECPTTIVPMGTAGTGLADAEKEQVEGPPTLCVDLVNDAENCGVCGHACDSDEYCRRERCTPRFEGVSCGTGQYFCSGVCVDFMNDENNCGGCGTRCTSDESCCSGECLDTTNDPEHCGSCDFRCASLFTTSLNCWQGQCIGESICGEDRTPLGPGEICCEGEVVHATNSEYNCGGCGIHCGVGETCCGNTCVDLRTSGNNCGSCGRSCPYGYVCCGGECVTPDTEENCGACGNRCAEDEKCCGDGFWNRDPSPEPYRPSWLDITPPSCKTVETGTCGGCGEICGEDELCCNEECRHPEDPDHCGSCSHECDTGMQCCDGQCIDTYTDEDNCGLCGRKCPWWDECVRGYLCCWYGTGWHCRPPS